MRIFFIGLVAAQQHPLWRLTQDEAAVRQLVNVLTRRGQPRWGSREVWVIRSGGFEEGSGVRHLRPSRDHVAGDLEIQAFPQRRRLSRTHSRTADERGCGVSSDQSKWS